MKKSTLLEIIAAITVLSMLLAACAPASAPAPQPTAVEAAETTPEPVVEATKDTSPCHYIEEAYGDGFRFRASDSCGPTWMLIYSNRASDGLLFISLVEGSKEWSQADFGRVTTTALYGFNDQAEEEIMRQQICNAVHGQNGVDKRIPFDGQPSSKSLINTFLVTHPCVVATPNPGG